MSRSRYTIYQTLIDIEACLKKITSTKEIEKSSRDQLHDSIYTANRISNDPWDQWESDKARNYIDEDTKWYQSCIRKRMKIEKELRLLELRLIRLQSY